MVRSWLGHARPVSTTRCTIVGARKALHPGWCSHRSRNSPGWKAPEAGITWREALSGYTDPVRFTTGFYQAHVAGKPRLAGALAPGARDVGVIGEITDEQRLAVIDVATGALHFATPADTYVYEYDWSPEGRQFAITYAKGNGDNNWWIARLARVDAGGGAIHDLFAPAFQLNDPQWSPDGLQIAVIGGVMSDFGSTGGDLYLVDSSSGNARNAFLYIEIDRAGRENGNVGSQPAARLQLVTQTIQTKVHNSDSMVTHTGFSVVG